MKIADSITGRIVFLSVLLFGSFLLMAGAEKTVDGITPRPGGSTTQVQFNNRNRFGGDSTFTFSTTTKRVSVSSMSATFMQASTVSLTQLGFSDGTTQTTAASGSGGLVSLSTGVTGILPVTNGGTSTGTAVSNGQMPIGNGGVYSPKYLTAGTGIAITTGAGSVSIAATGSSGGGYSVEPATVTFLLNKGFTASTATINTTLLVNSSAPAASPAVFVSSGGAATGQHILFKRGSDGAILSYINQSDGSMETCCNSYVGRPTLSGDTAYIKTTTRDVNIYNAGARATLFSYDPAQSRTTFYDDIGAVSISLFDAATIGIGNALNTSNQNQLEIVPGAAPYVRMRSRDALTTTVANVGALRHNTTGTAATGFGESLVMQLDDSTTADQSAGNITATWANATHATRQGRLSLYVSDFNGDKEAVRFDTSGTISTSTFYSVMIGTSGIQMNAGSRSAPPYSFSSAPQDGMWSNGVGNVVITGNNTNLFQANTSAIRVASGIQVNWSSGDPAVSGGDVGFKRAAAGSIQVTDGSAGSGNISASSFTATGAGYGFPDGTTQTTAFVNPVIFVSTQDFLVQNTTTISTITAGYGVGSLTLSANALTQGKSVNFFAVGYSSSAASATLNVRVSFGTTTILNSGAVTINSSIGAVANVPFRIDGTITTRATGSSGTVMGQLTWRHDTKNSSGLADSVVELSPSTLTTTTIDTTASQLINVSFQWGAASTSNGLVITNFVVKKEGT